MSKPDTLMGIPIVWVDDMPGIKAGDIVLGDLSAYYSIRSYITEDKELGTTLLEIAKAAAKKCTLSGDDLFDALVESISRSVNEFANQEFERSFNGEGTQEPVGIINITREE